MVRPLNRFDSKIDIVNMLGGREEKSPVFFLSNYSAPEKYLLPYGFILCSGTPYKVG
tara:strand:- start:1001 stop:1171 length:171 start_codon:yes stop_codon:yes gene_type:complete